MFRLTADHIELQKATRAFLADRAPLDAGSEPMTTDDIRSWWQKADTELGLATALVPQSAGGLGLDFGYAAVLLEEAGRVLLDAPLLPVVVGIRALVSVMDTTAAQELLGGLAESRIIGMALGQDADVRRSPLRATTTLGTEEHALSGRLDVVLYARTIDVLLVVAIDEAGGPGLYAVDTAGPGCITSPLAGIDLRREAATVEFSNTPARRLELGRDPGGVLARIGDTACIAAAVEQVGTAERAMEMSVDYAKTREQFGRAIGSFQAIKHRCAEMLVRVERARSATYFGITQVLDDGDLAEAAALAQAVASEALEWIAYENVQVHGGIGFTWEHPAHLIARRATSGRVLLGAPALHKDRLVDALAHRA